jgi:hypothetical protein
LPGAEHNRLHARGWGRSEKGRQWKRDWWTRKPSILLSCKLCGTSFEARMSDAEY